MTPSTSMAEDVAGMGTTPCVDSAMSVSKRPDGMCAAAVESVTVTEAACSPTVTEYYVLEDDRRSALDSRFVYCRLAAT